jgi:hypothetical protein
VLNRDVVSHHPTPRYWQPMSLDTEDLSNPSVLTHLYTMRDFYLCLSFNNRGEQQTWSALDDQHKGLRHHAGLGIE